jgi:choline-sulfatase
MPNTVILMSDEHNPLYAGPYGHPMVQTPNMDRMATEGTTYRNAYTPCPLCLPARSAFLAGLPVHRVQAYNNCNLLLDSSLPTFGDVLSEAGIHCVFMGKTDIYRPGEAMGFTELAELRDRKPPGDVNFVRRPLAIRKGAHRRADGYGVRPSAHVHDVTVVDRAVEWIRRSDRVSEPWVLVVNITAPHFPHVSTQELWDLYPDGGDLPAYGREVESARHPYAQDLRDHFETERFTEEQVRGLRRGYLACITFVDRQLGRLLSALEEQNALDRTDVIYTSDHGEMLGKFGMWWKCSLYEDSVRIPALAMGPDFAASREVATPVDLHDVRASIFAAASVDRPADWLGEPLQSLPTNDPKRAVFSEYHGHGTRAGAFMVRRGAWKLISYREGPDQLFDLSADPDELRNVIEGRTDVASQLDRELRRFCDPKSEDLRARDFEHRQIEAVRRDYPEAAAEE